MPNELNADKLNFLILQASLQLIENNSETPYGAWLKAGKAMAQTLEPATRELLRGQRFERIPKLIRDEHIKLLNNNDLHPRVAWNLAAQKVAQWFEVDFNEFQKVIKSRCVKGVCRDPEYTWADLDSERNQNSLARRSAWHTYRELFEAILKILYEYDLIKITDHVGGPSEYGAEVNTILPRLLDAQSEDDVWKIIYEEFVRWFDNSSIKNCYWFDLIARDVWEILPQYQ